MDSGTVDSAHDSDTGPDAPDAEDARSDATDAMDSGTVDSALGEDASGVLLSIPLPNMQPSGLAIDQTNNKLYVAVVDPNTGNNLGFSVIDTLTQAVSGSIAPPVVNGVPVQGYYGSELLAFDPGANLLYAVPGGTTVDVFDGATNTFKTSFSIAGPPLTEVCDGIIWLAIDSASSRLYASCADIASGHADIVVVDTTDDTVVTGIVLVDLGSPSAALAIDTTNNLLFASNIPEHVPTGEPIHVDTIDTTMNMVTGAQQVLGNATSVLVGPVGQPGSAALVTVDQSVTDGGVSSTFCSLEPALKPLDPSFVVAFMSAVGTEDTFLIVGTFAGTDIPIIVEVKVNPVEGRPAALGPPYNFRTPPPSLPEATYTPDDAVPAGNGNFYMTVTEDTQSASMPVPGVWYCQGPPPLP